MTIRIIAAAVLLASLAGSARAQGWGGEGTDPNHPKPKAEVPVAKPVAPAPVAATPAAKPAIVAKADKAEKIEKPAAVSNPNSDAELDRARVAVDKQFAVRKNRLNTRTAKYASYHIAMEKDRIEAERQMAEERKAFLLYLKSVPQEDRAQAMSAFEDRQESKRKELDKRHLSQYKAWYEEHIRDAWRSSPLTAEKVAVEVVAAPVVPAAAPAAPAAAAETEEGEETAAAPAAAKPAPATVARTRVKKRGKR